MRPRPGKNKGGRPTKMTPLVVKKLEEAFSWGCSDEEACVYAGISRPTLEKYQKENEVKVLVPVTLFSLERIDLASEDVEDRPEALDVSREEVVEWFDYTLELEGNPGWSE